jgi:hypothetical protein
VLSNKLKTAFIVLFVAGLIVVYKTFDPATGLFPKCPFLQVTGLQCPGCGSQRAVHHLLNAEFKEAFALNPLLIISIPYIIIGYLFEILPLNQKGLKARKALFGTKAILFILVIVIGFAVWRNL